MKCSVLGWVSNLQFEEFAKYLGNLLVTINFQRKPSYNEISGIDFWSEFLSGCSWEHILEILCKNGRFAEARLIWCRYRRTLEEWIKEEGNFEHLLAEIHLTIGGESLRKLFFSDCNWLLIIGGFLKY